MHILTPVVCWARRRAKLTHSANMRQFLIIYHFGARVRGMTRECNQHVDAGSTQADVAPPLSEGPWGCLSHRVLGPPEGGGACGSLAWQFVSDCELKKGQFG